MLWEIMFELMIELFKVTGEICSTFWNLMKEIIKFFKDTKGKNGQKKNAAPGEATADDAAAKTKGQLVLIVSIVGLVALAGGAFMFPKLQHATLGKAGIARSVIVETPRNEFPMGEYTVAQLYKKMKITLEEEYASRTVYYYWHAPKAPPGRRLPLVLVLHGKDGACPAAVRLRMAAVQRLFPSFLLIPQAAPGKVWDAPARYSGEEFKQAQAAKPPGEEARALRTAIILLANVTGQEPAVDQDRMYVIGCDEGGDGVYGAAAHYPGVFAAGVALGAKWSYLDAPKMTRMPLLILHGGADKVVPPAFAASMAQVINAAGGRAAHHEFPGVGHDCESPNFYSGGVWKWLFSQRRPAPQPAAAPATAATRAP